MQYPTRPESWPEACCLPETDCTSFSALTAAIAAAVVIPPEHSSFALSLSTIESILSCGYSEPGFYRRQLLRHLVNDGRSTFCLINGFYGCIRKHLIINPKLIHQAAAHAITASAVTSQDKIKLRIHSFPLCPAMEMEEYFSPSM